MVEIEFRSLVCKANALPAAPASSHPTAPASAETAKKDPEQGGQAGGDGAGPGWMAVGRRGGASRGTGRSRGRRQAGWGAS